MRKLTAAVLVLTALAAAQTQTFRSMSTEGMILDDLDTWRSGILGLQALPDRLLKVEGIRIYSGLSNLATGTDHVFDESGDTRGGFLLGGSYSRDAVPWAVGLLTEFLNERTFGEISLMGPSGTPYVTGEGFVEGTWSQFTDTNGDGTLDTRRTQHETAEARVDSSLTSTGLYGAYMVSETVDLGLGVTYRTTGSELMPANDNGTLCITDSNLVTGVETYLFDSSSRGTVKEDRSSITITASGTGRVSDMMSIGGMFLFSSVSSDITSEYEDFGTEDFLPGQTGVYDISNWTATENMAVSPGGSRFGGGLNLEYILDENWKIEASGGFYTGSLSGSSTDYSMSQDSSYIVTMGSLIDSTIVSMDGSGGTDLDLTDDDLALGAKLTLDPSSTFIVSLGAAFRMNDNTSTITNSSDNILVETYSDGDDQMADPDDYVSTTTWSQSMETRTTVSTTRISVPVGLEFQVLPRFRARLGASPAFVWEKDNETSTLTDASPMVTHTVFGDGSEQQSVEDPFETVDGTLVETDEFYTDIPYSYGVGYSPADHVQIDLMGLGDNFDQWRLSATLLF